MQPGLTGLNPKHTTQVGSKTVYAGLDLYILFALLLDGPTCRRISACLTHSLSVWPPPPSSLPTLSLCLSLSLSPPLSPVFVLIIAEVMWARQSQWIMWLEEAQAQSLYSDRSSHLGLQSHLSGISRWKMASIRSSCYLRCLSFTSPLFSLVFKKVSPALSDMSVSAAMEHRCQREYRVWESTSVVV